jgi:predicted DNA-binding WGR domain protein
MSADPKPARYPNGRFGPGNPGRPLGSRNRMTKKKIREMLLFLGAYQAAAEAMKAALVASRRRRKYGENTAQQENLR